MVELFSLFLKEKRYLQNVSENTLEFYRYSFQAFNLTEPLTQSQLNQRVVELRESGKFVSCVETYTRGINPLLTWLHENHHLKERLKVKRAKLEQQIMKPLSDAQLRAIIAFRPKNRYELRPIPWFVWWLVVEYGSMKP